MTNFGDFLVAMEPYEVTCARCGKLGMCDDFIIEEGDEWECPPCWERCNAAELAAHKATEHRNG